MYSTQVITAVRYHKQDGAVINSVQQVQLTGIATIADACSVVLVLVMAAALFVTVEEQTQHAEHVVHQVM